MTEPTRRDLAEPSWARDAVFMHVYPLGACGAPAENDFTAAPTPRLDSLLPWIDAWADMGINAIYLGPVFESSSHGYDTANFFIVDRRLGDDDTLARFCEKAHARGMKVVFDAVFNHVGREFWSFRDVREKGEASVHRSWFAGLRFDRRNRFGEPFVYEGWRGIDTLVKLNLEDGGAREHLFLAVQHWVSRFGIDGLRLDAADAMNPVFFDALASFCAGLGRELWLLGEVIHGDYRLWARPGRLHATTDYTLSKALWSSHNDRNYFELAHTLDRQVGREGMYRDLALYTFVDNHDVDRLASKLRDPRNLPLVYSLLFTLPGIPSIYAGSEWGAEGKKHGGDDRALRPVLPASPPSPSPLRATIEWLIGIRHAHAPLRRGAYRSLVIRNEQFAFVRELDGEAVVIAANCSDAATVLDVPWPSAGDRSFRDMFNESETVRAQAGNLRFDLPPHAARAIRLS